MTGFEMFVQYSWFGVGLGMMVYFIGIISGLGLRWFDEHVKPK